MEKNFCFIGERLGNCQLIECNDISIVKRRGINFAVVSLSHPCFEISSSAEKNLIRDGYEVLSQEEYCRVHGIKHTR